MKESFDEKYDAIVIGAGLAGLTCGITFAKRGKSVKVFEHHSVPGGCISYFKRKGFIFDVGLHFTTDCHEGGIVYTVLKDLGLLNDIKFHNVDPVYEIRFLDESYSIPANFENYMSMLSKKFPEEKRGIVDLFETIETIYKDLSKLPEVSPTIGRYFNKTFSELIDDFISDKRVKDIIGGGWTLMGFPPSRISALVLAGLYASLNNGGFFPVGGTKAFVDALVKALERYGGKIEFNKLVNKIIVEDGKAIGIETNDGKKIGGNYIISNASAKQTFFKLVGENVINSIDPNYLKNLNSLEVGISAFLVYLGVDMDLKNAGIKHHEIVFHTSHDFDKEYEEILNGDVKSSFLIVIPTLTDESIAPKGKHIVIVLAFAPYELKGKDWRAEKERITDEIIKIVEERVIPGLSKHIVVRESATPKTLERYTLNTNGAIVGWAPNPSSLKNRPLPNTPVKNLYLAGQWTTPGGGTTNVIPSGWMVANMILSEG
jgi:phytoene desaturase